MGKSMTSPPARSDVDSSKRSKKRRALEVGIVVVITIVAAEILLRFFMGNAHIAPYINDPGDGRCLGLDPGGEVTYTGWRWRIDPVTHDSNTISPTHTTMRAGT